MIYSVKVIYPDNYFEVYHAVASDPDEAIKLVKNKIVFMFDEANFDFSYIIFKTNPIGKVSFVTNGYGK